MLFLVVGFNGCRCQDSFEPISYHKDACHHCKMQITNHRFAGEIVMKKGKTYKFDSLTCMRSFYQENSGEVADIYVGDFYHKEHLLSARKAYFYLAHDMRSPMGAGYVAVSSEEDLEKIVKEHPGKVIDWKKFLEEK